MQNESLIARMAHLEGRIDALSTRLDARIDKLEARIDKLDAKLGQMTWMVIGTWVTIMLTLFFHH